MDKIEINEMEEFLKQMPKEKIDQINKKEVENTENQHIKFHESFIKGKCYICDSKLDSFDEKKPCVHWLLRPKGFKKKHLKLIYEKFNYSNIDSYLRWVANEGSRLSNINDLTDDLPESKVFEYTIKYENFEWTLSCSSGDYEGHKNSRFGKYPHYHIQMRIDGNPFINFSDAHIPLTHYDQYIISVMNNKIKGVEHYAGFGAGMKAYMDNFTPEEMLQHTTVTEDPKKSTIHTSYMVEAEPGTKISGEDIQKLLKERDKTKKPLWNLLPKLKNVKTTAIVGPGESVPEVFNRKSRKSKSDEENNLT